ncbi:hypothetical protein CR513_05837, partial [Mucuna pruriens]
MALLGKWWQMKRKQRTLWCRVLKQKYEKEDEFWEIGGKGLSIVYVEMGQEFHIFYVWPL